jgi:hypothetical protein
VIGKKEQVLGKVEVHGVVLAMMSRHANERRRDLAMAKMAM